jgi:NAD(P)-dependent dehydrogenase (short-subunit alcohol dehydrogenase family)
MSLSQFRLDGKTALITGANRGIGLAIAQLFLKAGAHCMLTSRSQTSAFKRFVRGQYSKSPLDLGRCHRRANTR